MVSFPHQWGSDGFRCQPLFVLGLVRKYLGSRLPAGTRMEIGDPSAVDPNLPDWQADCVVLFRRPDDTVAHAVIIEVQLDYRTEKLLRWPEYVTVIRGKNGGCPTELLVVCFTKGLARWAGRPIVLSLSGSVIRPMVVGPESFPRIDDPEVAIDLPGLAALSLAAHPEDPQVGEAVLAALKHMYKQDPNMSDEYHDFLFKILAGPGRKMLGDLMSAQTEEYVYQSSFARRYIAKGEKRGRAEGEARGEARALLRVLAHRNIALTAADRERIMACTDPATLDAWLDRALVVTSTRELFA